MTQRPDPDADPQQTSMSAPVWCSEGEEDGWPLNTYAIYLFYYLSYLSQLFESVELKDAGPTQDHTTRLPLL